METVIETKQRGFSSAALKLIAIVLMFVDHFAVVFRPAIEGAFDGGDTLYTLMRTAARIAFPIFAYCIAAGAVYTSNIYKYMLRLAAFAVISEVPFDRAFNGAWLEFTYQNVFFTLLLGLLSIALYAQLRKRNLEVFAFVLLAGLAYAAEELLKTDYGAMGVICIFLFYVFLQTKAPVKQIGLALTCLLVSFMLSFRPYVNPVSYYVLPGTVMTFHDLHMDASVLFNSAELFAVAAAPFILLHSGQKGRKINKWFFYAFYPGHLLLLAVAYRLIFRVWPG